MAWRHLVPLTLNNGILPLKKKLETKRKMDRRKPTQIFKTLSSGVKWYTAREKKSPKGVWMVAE